MSPPICATLLLHYTHALLPSKHHCRLRSCAMSPSKLCCAVLHYCRLRSCAMSSSKQCYTLLHYRCITAWSFITAELVASRGIKKITSRTQNDFTDDLNVHGHRRAKNKDKYENHSKRPFLQKYQDKKQVLPLLCIYDTATTD